MKRTLERLYKAGRLTKEGLMFYVDHGMLSKEDYEEITGEKVAKATGSK